MDLIWKTLGLLIRSTKPHWIRIRLGILCHGVQKGATEGTVHKKYSIFRTQEITRTVKKHITLCFTKKKTHTKLCFHQRPLKQQDSFILIFTDVHLCDLPAVVHSDTAEMPKFFHLLHDIQVYFASLQPGQRSSCLPFSSLHSEY